MAEADQDLAEPSALGQDAQHGRRSAEGCDGESFNLAWFGGHGEGGSTGRGIGKPQGRLPGAWSAPQTGQLATQ